MADAIGTSDIKCSEASLPTHIISAACYFRFVIGGVLALFGHKFDVVRDIYFIRF
jgi:hypothetical protein